MTVFIPFLLFLVAILGTDASWYGQRSKNINEFFPEINGNLTKITWAHAVNSKEFLEESLNSEIMMLEADVVIGKYIMGDKSEDDVPIMSHPPFDTSDLSLEKFLDDVKNHNDKANVTKKGIKLDFKTIEAFERSTGIINELYHEMNFPVWFNADILRGPLNATDEPVNASQFITSAKQFKNGTLSIGWKTVFGGEIIEASYTKEHIDEMLLTISGNQIEQSITFPVRAGIACQSIEELKYLIDEVPNSTLTLWTAPNDYINIEELRNLISIVMIEKIYIDLPNEILDLLRLDELQYVSAVNFINL